MINLLHHLQEAFANTDPSDQLSFLELIKETPRNKDKNVATINFCPLNHSDVKHQMGRNQHYMYFNQSKFSTLFAIISTVTQVITPLGTW